MHAVDGGMNGSTVLFVCRAKQGGTDYDVGHLDWTGCHTMTGRVMTLRKNNYQVLVNLDGSARLVWREWNQYLTLTPGAVHVSNDVYVARKVGFL